MASDDWLVPGHHGWKHNYGVYSRGINCRVSDYRIIAVWKLDSNGFETMRVAIRLAITARIRRRDIPAQLERDLSERRLHCLRNRGCRFDNVVFPAAPNYSR